MRRDEGFHQRRNSNLAGQEVTFWAGELRGIAAYALKSKKITGAGLVIQHIKNVEIYTPDIKLVNEKYCKDNKVNVYKSMASRAHGAVVQTPGGVSVQLFTYIMPGENAGMILAQGGKWWRSMWYEVGDRLGIHWTLDGNDLEIDGDKCGWLSQIERKNASMAEYVFYANLTIDKKIVADSLKDAERPAFGLDEKGHRIDPKRFEAVVKEVFCEVYGATLKTLTLTTAEAKSAATFNTEKMKLIDNAPKKD